MCLKEHGNERSFAFKDMRELDKKYTDFIKDSSKLSIFDRVGFSSDGMALFYYVFLGLHYLEKDEGIRFLNNYISFSKFINRLLRQINVICGESEASKDSLIEIERAGRRVYNFLDCGK